jgi:tRNA-dihydrouridine synthase
VLVGRGVLRNPWILAQAADLAAGRTPRDITLADRGRFLLDYISLLQRERVHEPSGFRHTAPASEGNSGAGHRAVGHDRWVVNKIRALGSWYTKGLDNGSHIRTAINTADSIGRLAEIVDVFFVAPLAVPASDPCVGFGRSARP